MSVNEKIMRAVTPLVPVCRADIYRPAAGEAEADTYCTFTYTEAPSVYGDGEPEAVRYLVQLHLFLPLSQSPIALKRSLRRAVLDMGCAVGEFLNLSDLDGQHHVLEFEYVDGEVG